MAKKTPEERANDIARQTFDEVRRGPDACTAAYLLKLGKQNLRGFRGVPRGVAADEFSGMIEKALQEILDQKKVFGPGVLQAHVKIEHHTPIQAEPILSLPGWYSGLWHVTAVS